MRSIQKNVVVLLTVALVLGLLPVAPFAAKEAKAAVTIECTVDLSDEASIAAAVSGNYIDLATDLNRNAILILKDGVELTGKTI